MNEKHEPARGLLTLLLLLLLLSANICYGRRHSSWIQPTAAPRVTGTHSIHVIRRGTSRQLNW
jgi:hypothetical protein